MVLSPEEKRKIYEEERARIEAREKIETEKQTAGSGTSKGLTPNTAALLCYVGIWVTGIIFLLIEQKNKFVRFHAAQSIIVFGILTIAGIILGWIPVVGLAFSWIISVVGFILWIVLMVKAYNGQLYKIPWVGDIAEKMLASAYGKVREDIEAEAKDEHVEPPTPAGPAPPPVAEKGKQIGEKIEDYFRNTRGGRVASSSAAIAWSVVLLIFFNFFNQYIAFYQHETVGGVTGWVRYPFLTGDFSAVLPILTATLILSIIGHIILLVFDKYSLREIILIILNIFGIITVATFLSVFPFDFSVIPQAGVAAVVTTITTIVLIGIIIGLGVGTLVKFIKLIVYISKKAI